VSTQSRAPRIAAADARARIREAASRLLARGSYRDLTVDQVMAEAGLARTVFYRHFDGLPALALSLLDDLRGAFEGGGDPASPGFLRRVLDDVVEIARRHGPLLRAIDDAARHDEAVERAYRASLDWASSATAAVWRANIASGLVRPVPDVDAAARALTVLNGAYLIETLGRDQGADPRVVADTLWTIWARTLGLDPA
jgi:AcrR family transcriptional regulator